jgi:transcriptional regulator with XRE-family HTH domain
VPDKQLLRLLGENIRRARLAANLTQECLAELIGVHWQTVSYLENGKFFFTAVNLIRISQALGVSTDSLLDGLPEPDAKRLERIKKAKARKRRPRRLKGK